MSENDAGREQWKRPDREAVIRDNPLLDYCRARGWKLKRDGAADRYKCPCPLHSEKTPSFTIYLKENRFHCFGCEKDGNVIDLHAELHGMSGMEAMCGLAGIDYHNGKEGGGQAGARKPREQQSASASARDANPERYDPLADQEKARKREGWPLFEPPTQAEIAAIATLRGLSPEGVTIAVERDLLFCADYQEKRAWIITDSQRFNAQARRLDGRKWIIDGEAKKAWTLPGSVGAWPIGLGEALSFPAIALVEGGPDLLAALHLAWCSDVENCLGVVAMMGGPLILESVLPRFADKRIRIFADADESGLKAEGCWWHQLEAAGAIVDGYSFTGFLRSDGFPVKDLNDFVRIDYDQWEEKRDFIEGAFAFPANPQTERT